MGFFLKLKIKTNTILPIILGLILPVFPIYSDNGNYTGDAPLIGVWLFSSLVVYLLWQLLWQLWDIMESRKIWSMVGLFFIIIFLMNINKVLLEIDTDSFPIFSILRMGFMIILFLSIQYAIKSQQNMSRLLLEKEKLQTENYKTQLQSLRSKVDPHFLFNTLNTLRIMVRNQHNETEKFVMSLSDFYRQTLEHDDNSTIELTEEIEVLEAYLFLMQSRNQTGLTIEIDIDSTLYKRFIPTLALQIVTENCFKHNTMSAAEPLSISIKNTDDAYISICNNFQPKLTYSEPSGHGLDNILKRYELLGIENGIKIQPTSDFFEVQLKLI